jgi:hypothetical protein
MKFCEEDVVFISKSDRVLGDGESGGSKSIYDQCAAIRRRRNQVYAGAKPSRLMPQERAWASTAGLVEDDDAPGLEGGGGKAGLAHGLEGALAEAGHVETVVLVGLHGFHEQGVVGLEGAGAAEHLVGALEGLDGEDGALADDAALADVEPGAFAGDVDAVFQYSRSMGKRRPVMHAGVASWSSRKARASSRVTPSLGSISGDGAEDGLGVAALEGEKNRVALRSGCRPLKSRRGVIWPAMRA